MISDVLFSGAGETIPMPIPLDYPGYTNLRIELDFRSGYSWCLMGDREETPEEKVEHELMVIAANKAAKMHHIESISGLLTYLGAPIRCLACGAVMDKLSFNVKGGNCGCIR